jgi:superfamily II DNA or RNA helicase
LQAKVQGGSEVRFRINLEGRCIQWVECTCRKYRTTGVNCEHIAAFAIYLDREKPEILGQLNFNMPMKPLASTKKTRQIQKDRQPTAAIGNKILEHSMGQILGVTLIKGGPNIRVKAEIRAGDLTSFEMNCDQAGEMLQKGTIPAHALKNPALSLQREMATMGCYLSLAGEEQLHFQKALLIPLTQAMQDLNLSALPHARILQGYHDKSNTWPADTASFLALSVKKYLKYMGKSFLFLPKIGYFPLAKLPSSEAWWSLPLEQDFTGDDFAEAMLSGFSRFEDAPMLIDPQLTDIKIVDDATWQNADLNDVSPDWFALDPVYGNPAVQVRMVDMIRVAREKKYFKKGKFWFKIPELVSQFEWQLDKEGQNVAATGIQFHRLNAALGGFDRIAGSKEMLKRLSDRVEFSPEGECPDLSHTNLNLRSYQQDGLRWFWWLHRNELAGLLADEMGLGKTHQAMAYLSGIQSERPDFRFLVVCPTTVIEHWHQKISEFAPQLSPILFHGAGRQHSLNLQGKTIVTSYGIVLRDVAALQKISWDAILLDEAHYIKNNKTSTYQAISSLNSRARICLTGTPIENNLVELKNIFDFLLPGYLGSDEYFRKRYINPIAQNSDKTAELSLQKLIHPFKLRRTKKQVMKDLPDKIEDFVYSNLSEDQSRIYREILQMRVNPLLSKMREPNESMSTLHVFAVLNLLKQVCDHPALVVDDPSGMKMVSGKFEAFKELIQQCLDAGSKIVVFSQYLQMIDIISKHLDSMGVQHVTLTGASRNRGQLIKTFQEDDKCRVFVGSLLAGGVGIDLTAASVVIHYDRWWNASKENQATDRVHRIGQERAVQVFKMITKGTLEEKINLLIARKQSLFDKFIERDEELFQSLSREDLIELLS